MNGEGRKNRKLGAHSRLFARRVAAKYRRPPGPAALASLGDYFRTKFSSREAGRPAGEKFYRRGGKKARHTAGQGRLNLALSLNFTPLTPATYPSFTRLSSSRGAATLQKEVLRRETFLAGAAPAKYPLALLRYEGRTSRELKERSAFCESFAREVFDRTRLETVRVKKVGAWASQPAPAVRGQTQARPGVSLTRHAQTFLLAQTTRQTPLVAGAAKTDAAMRVHVSTGRVESVLPAPVPHETVLRERIKYRATPPGVERTFFNTLRLGGAGRRAPFETPFLMPDAPRLQRGGRLEFVRGALPARVSPGLNRAGESGASKSSARPLTSRTGPMPAGAGPARVRTMPRAGAGGQFLSGRRENLERVLIALRRETVLELPPVARVFAPPQRPAPEARSAVKRVEEKEVVETVRREVRTQLKAHSAVESFTRADFNVITDRIYDALARRLLNERERLGLNS